MSLVFAGICSHAPGITGRAQLADRDIAGDFFRCYRSMGDELAAARPDALVIVAAEHFANFFMNNMPAFAVGMAESYGVPSRIRSGWVLRAPSFLEMRRCRSV
jgi:2,3-dihydroxyphenylpropionate 1,2-dioxygenase